MVNTMKQILAEIKTIFHEIHQSLFGHQAYSGKSGFVRTLSSDLKAAYIFYLDEESRNRLFKMNPIRKWFYGSWWVFKSMYHKLSAPRRIILILGILLSLQNRTDNSQYSLLGVLLICVVVLLELKDKLLAFDELREARQLQISMLPSSPPKSDKIEAAFFMKTANDVGGDYYDYHETEDGAIIFVLGDATGHGMKAGVLTAVMKSLFSTIDPKSDCSDFFNRCTGVLQSMKLENMYMSMTLLKIEGNLMTVSAAGMPPVYYFNQRKKMVMELSEGGIPLGFQSFAYKKQHVTLESGDVILMMSDGFPELFNEKNVMIGYENVKNIFLTIVEKNPGDIIKYLSRYAIDWRGDRPQDDDIAFVCLKVT